MAVSIVLVRVLVEACTKYGVPRERLFDATDFDATRLDDNDGRLSLPEYERLLATAIELTGQPALGLQIGEYANFSGFDVGAGLMAFAASLRDALNTYLRFQRIFGEIECGSSLEESEEHATLRYQFARGSAAYNRFRAELSMAGFLRLIRYFASGEANLHAVYFEHAAPSYVSEYARVFEGAERFDQRFTGIAFPKVLLDRGTSHRDPDLYSALEILANRKLLKLNGAAGVKPRIVEYLLSKPVGRRPAMEEVAKELGMSARSLRRRLNEEGVTYAQACDEGLAQLAKSLLSDPRQSITGTAYALGFSDTASFHRAFKRWTGLTPKQYRHGG